MENKNIYKALANFQYEVPIIHKDTQGFNYTYADLPAIIEVITPLMKTHGLGYTQLLQGKSIQTIIFHAESGEFIESTVYIPQDVEMNKMNQFQVLGSAITYLRRYALSSALGLVTDKDTDASSKAPQKASQPQEKASDEPFTTDENGNLLEDDIY